MNAKQWHYALDGEQKGPFSEEDFERLISAGVVGRDTMVWTDDMAAWETLARVRPDTAPPSPFQSLDVGMHVTQVAPTGGGLAVGAPCNTRYGWGSMTAACAISR